MPYDDDALSGAWSTMYADTCTSTGMRNWFFGFASMEQCLSWIGTTNVMQALEDNGLAISVYECELVHIGNTQAIFDHRSVRLVDEISIRKARSYNGKEAA